MSKCVPQTDNIIYTEENLTSCLGKIFPHKLVFDPLAALLPYTCAASKGILPGVEILGVNTVDEIFVKLLYYYSYSHKRAQRHCGRHAGGLTEKRGTYLTFFPRIKKA